MNYLVGGKAPGRLGNAHPNIVPYQDFRTRDGCLILAVGNALQFRRFCPVCGQAEWADDPRFATTPRSEEHRLGKDGVSTCSSWWSPFPTLDNKPPKLTKYSEQ